ncbi:hypothetical protein [Desulfovibrio inopinatus]|uniref:hypothetical protein n=1 Tax=Desulfovibrio inopinatus TaxID=102109 RepID=UPI000413072E|nr:hypothetical protein [Desulfovibrio inopinatus]
MFWEILTSALGGASGINSILSNLFGGSDGDSDALLNNAFGFMNLSNMYNLLSADQAAKQEELADTAFDMAQKAWQRYEDKYVPLEDAQIDAAQSDLELYQPLKKALVENTLGEMALYAPLKEQQVQMAMSSLGRADQLEHAVAEEALRQEEPDEKRAADAASGQVRQTFAQTKKTQDQKLKGLGLDPARFANLSAGIDRDQAASEAAARTGAMQAERERATNENWQRLTAGLGMMRGGSGVSVPSYSPMAATTSSTNPMNAALGLTSTAASGLSGLQKYYSGLSGDYYGLGASSASQASALNAGNSSGLLGLFG